MRMTVPILTGLVLALPASAADWPNFMGPDRNGISPETGLARVWPTNGPRTLWTRPVESGFGAPSVRGNDVYYLGRDNETWRDAVHCLDLQTGREKWVYEYYAYGEVSYNGRGQPTIDETCVFSMGPFGDLHCIDRATGKRVWSRNILNKPRVAEDPTAVPPKNLVVEDPDDLGRQQAPRWGVSQSPVLYRDTVIVPVLSPSAAVAAFDRKTGQFRWKSPPAGRMIFSHQTPLLATLAGVDQVLVTGNVDNGPPAILSACDAGTGKQLWAWAMAKYNIPIPSPVAIDTNRVFIAGGYNAGCTMLRITRTGEVYAVESLFRSQDCTPMIQTPILFGGFLYANSYDPYHNSRRGVPNRGFMCLDLDGRIRWETGAQNHFDQGPFLVADGLIFLLHGREGTLHLVEANPDRFVERARAPVFAPVASPANPSAGLWSPMALADGKLLLRNATELRCLEVRPPADRTEPAAPVAGVDLRVTVTDLRNVSGQVFAAVFTSVDGFPGRPESAYQTRMVDVTGTVVQVSFTNVPPGTCAVSAFHDENGNRRLDTGMFGRPREGTAASRDARNAMGPPSFTDAAFAVTNHPGGISIRMRYPGE